MDVICTVIATNYVPQALALMESATKFHPEMDFCVLIADGTTNQYPPLAGARVFIPDELGIDPKVIQEMFTYYDSIEISTALKPLFLKFLLENGSETVTFLDPDTVLYGKLTEALVHARTHEAVIVPHRISPCANLTTDCFEFGFLKYGVFNLGFISVGKKSIPMLEWWAQRLRWFCTRYQGDIWFTDQKWIDLVPALFETKILKHGGYDLAPWNIDERLITTKNNLVFAGDDPLVFIHFSQMSARLAKGFDTPLWKNQLSVLSQESKLETLCFIEEETKEYSDKLVNLGRMNSHWPYNNLTRSTAQGKSFHYRKRLILRSLSNFSIESSGNQEVVNYRPAFMNKFSTLLERSAALNGLRDGLKKDFVRLKMRLDSKR
jgi:hypothetical protein